MIKKTATYLLIFLGLLFVYRLMLYEGIRKNQSGIFSKYHDLFLKHNNAYDVLFLGSSRAEMHFNPKIFDSITGLKSYNTGISGASPKISLALLKIYCHQHRKPKFIVFNIDYFSLQNDTDRLNDFPRYFPYLNNINLRNELQEIDNRFLSFYYNPLHSLPYTQIDYLSASLHGWLNIPGKYDSLMYKGFQTSSIQTFKHDDNPIAKHGFISIKNRKYIDSIILFTKANDIQMIAITSPVYGGGDKNVLNKTKLVSQLKNIANLHHITYLNYTDSFIYRNLLLYTDILHLNRQGARIFSESISLAFNNIYDRKPLFNK